MDPSARARRAVTLAALLLAVAVICVYARVAGHEFLTYDDPEYVSENPVVLRGFTLDGLRWAFTTTEMGNWNPVTWLSHMLDVELFGRKPGAHHAMNVAFHLANTFLLFGLLQRLTRAPWPSLTVAALFALHPLHVESVAWIAERKDLLSVFFGLLTIWAFVRWVDAPSGARYGAIVASFACALMAKPMLVTLPGVLLLLDFWPLGRMKRSDGVTRHTRPRGAGHPGVPLTALVREKLPLLAMSAVIGAVTYAAQRRAGGVTDLASVPMPARVANALVSYVRYLGKLVWPADLALVYPYDPALPLWQPVVATVFLVVVTAAVLRANARHPYALVGWFWYLGTLVPVIGLVQVGAQAYADRFTYLPAVGVFVILAWGGRSLVRRGGLPTRAVGVAVVALVAAYGLIAWAYLGVWRTSETLLSHTVAVTRGNFVAENNLGFALTVQGKLDAAMEHYRAALRIDPDYVEAYNNLGGVLTQAGRFPEAIEQYGQALQRRPGYPEAHHNLGFALVQSGQRQAAIGQYEEALRLRPDYVQAHYDLGVALGHAGRYDEAIAHFREVLRLRPGFAHAQNNLGTALAQAGRLQEAIAYFRQALVLDPNDADARYNLDMALAAQSTRVAQ